MPTKKPFNPFYLTLIPVGIVFVVTGFAYGYMAFQIANAAGDAAKQAGHPLFAWLRSNGDWLLLSELAVLAVLTVGAMVLESRQDKRADVAQSELAEANHARSNHARSTDDGSADDGSAEPS